MVATLFVAERNSIDIERPLAFESSSVSSAGHCFAAGRNVHAELGKSVARPRLHTEKSGSIPPTIHGEFADECPLTLVDTAGTVCCYSKAWRKNLKFIFPTEITAALRRGRRITFKALDVHAPLMRTRSRHLAMVIADFGQSTEPEFEEKVDITSSRNDL